ncbi:ZIP family metal transporter [Egicoccus sp. AB-alg2]|uniref:ZIP family metal transporter n=1 Tax=Egicoccus sp. AB-alg2 TaxID=3242693 RepID=UPI00359DA57D
MQSDPRHGMQALLIGAIGSSALVIGGTLGALWRPPMRWTGVLLAFASGTLLSALAFELFPDAVEDGGLMPAGLGLLAGALTFVVVNTLLDARVARSAGDPHQMPAVPDEAAERLRGAEAQQTERVEDAARGGKPLAVGLALVAAVTLDGVPENVALGVSMATDAGGGFSLALLVAIFSSNLPESLAGAVSMRRGGRSAAFAIAVWTVTAVVLTFAVVAGRATALGLGAAQLAFAAAFAGGAVLASLADTLMPEAFEHGRPLNAMATTAGFFLSFLLAQP